MLVKHVIHILLATALTFSLGSCTIMKRHYTHGFYVSSKSEVKEQPTRPQAKIKRNLNTQPTRHLITEHLVAASNTSRAEIVTAKEPLAYCALKRHIHKTRASLECDTIFLKDGTVMAVRVTEIGQARVKFRYCSGSDRAERSVPRHEIDHITYSNGTIERFENNSLSSVAKQTPAEREANGFAVAGFILSLLFYPILLVALFAALAGSLTTLSAGLLFVVAAGLVYLLGLIFSIVGTVQVANDKERYRGLGLAIAGLVISLIPIIVIASSYFRI